MTREHFTSKYEKQHLTHTTYIHFTDSYIIMIVSFFPTHSQQHQSQNQNELQQYTVLVISYNSSIWNKFMNDYLWRYKIVVLAVKIKGQ